MKGLPQTLVQNFQFEYLEGLQLPFRQSESIFNQYFYDDLLTSPKSQTSLAACVFLFVILALCCLLLLLFCFVLWWSGYQAVKQKIAISSDVTSSYLGVSRTTRKERRDGERWLCLPFLLLPQRFALLLFQVIRLVSRESRSACRGSCQCFIIWYSVCIHYAWFLTQDNYGTHLQSSQAWR